MLEKCCNNLLEWPKLVVFWLTVDLCLITSASTCDYKVDAANDLEQ